MNTFHFSFSINPAGGKHNDVQYLNSIELWMSCFYALHWNLLQEDYLLIQHDKSQQVDQNY